MGLYDRDYAREEQRGFVFGADQPMVVTLILVNVVLFLPDWFSGGQISKYLALQGDAFFHPWHLYQVLSYGFMHASLWQVVINMLVLYFFGNAVEGIYGKKEFLRLYITMSVVSGLAWLCVVTATVAKPDLPNQFVTGASGAVAGMLVLFVLHFPRRVFYFWGIFPVPAWLAASLYLLSDVFAFMRAGDHSPNSHTNVGYAIHLSAAAVALLYYKTGWNFGRITPSFSLPQRRKSPLRVHQPVQEENQSERVDKILEKIHQQGLDSLSRQERKILEEESRRVQRRQS